jgi:hypothetical protein
VAKRLYFSGIILLLKAIINLAKDPALLLLSRPSRHFYYYILGISEYSNWIGSRLYGRTYILLISLPDKAGLVVGLY